MRLYIIEKRLLEHPMSKMHQVTSLGKGWIISRHEQAHIQENEKDPVQDPFPLQS